jgi:hypothetical protein
MEEEEEEGIYCQILMMMMMMMMRAFASALVLLHHQGPAMSTCGCDMIWERIPCPPPRAPDLFKLPECVLWGGGGEEGSTLFALFVRVVRRAERVVGWTRFLVCLACDLRVQQSLQGCISSDSRRVCNRPLANFKI